MFTFDTESGSTYFVCEGRISRIQTQPIPGFGDLVDGSVFTWVTPPKVGQSARFRPTGQSRVISTTPVVEVINI